MRTHRSAAIAATLSIAAGLVLSELPSPPVAASSVATSDRDQLATLRFCESGSNYRINTGNGYYGAYQITAEVWRSLGYGGLPNQAAPSVQDEAAARLLAGYGATPWPRCGSRGRLNDPPGGRAVTRAVPPLTTPPAFNPPPPSETGPVARTVGELASHTLA